MARPVDPDRISPLGQDVIDEEDIRVARIEQATSDDRGDAVSPVDEAPAPDQITGRATRSVDDLTALFDARNQEQMADGFRGGSGDDVEVAPPDTDVAPTAED